MLVTTGTSTTQPTPSTPSSSTLLDMEDSPSNYVDSRGGARGTDFSIAAIIGRSGRGTLPEGLTQFKGKRAKHFAGFHNNNTIRPLGESKLYSTIHLFSTN